MNLRAVTLTVVQAAMAGCALSMGLWTHVPWLCAAGLAGLGLLALASGLPRAARWEGFWKWGAAAAWVCTATVLVFPLLARGDQRNVQSYGDYYYAVVGWLVAATLLPATRNDVNAPRKSQWRALVCAWAFSGAFLWLAAASGENRVGAFCLGLLLLGALLVAVKRWFPLPLPAVLAVNTLILLIIGLPLVDLALHPADFVGVDFKSMDPAAFKCYYCFSAARKDRSAFEHWWEYYQEQTIEMDDKLLLRDPTSPVPLRLRPNSHATFVRCPISINSKGFRGAEIPEPKGDAYRIVALGESTTFGFTINPEDKPWPELLEQLIRERLKPARPVQVINAGVPILNLWHNLSRFPKDILPLKPDMLICYHGINGFHLLARARRAPDGRSPPIYRRRPLQLLGDCEYRVRLMWFQHRHTSAAPLRAPALADLMETDYARAYRQLIEITQTNRIRLVLATFPLAVNSNSPPELVEFFRPRHPLVDFYIRANVAHARLVQELAREFPGVGLVDTRPHLDGEEEKYLDVMHVTQEGDRQLAETFFAGIRASLEEDLASHTTARAVPP